MKDQIILSVNFSIFNVGDVIDHLDKGEYIVKTYYKEGDKVSYILFPNIFINKIKSYWWRIEFWIVK